MIHKLADFEKCGNGDFLFKKKKKKHMKKQAHKTTQAEKSFLSKVIFIMRMTYLFLD